jgi:hypothetical protein
VMFLVWQFFVGNLLSVVLVLFPDTFENFYLQFRWPTGMTKHFMFHILWISILRLLYFNLLLLLLLLLLCKC